MKTRTDFEIISNSNYSDETIKDRVEEIDHKNALFPIACQLSVNGWGADNFGKVKVAGVEIVVKDYFDEIGVVYGNRKNADLSVNCVTPRRLIRAYRYEIHEWLKSYKSETFLVRKYGGRAVRPHKSWIFPCAEHLITEDEPAKALVLCYEAIDKLKGTNMAERVIQVMMVRGVNCYQP